MVDILNKEDADIYYYKYKQNTNRKLTKINHLIFPYSKNKKKNKLQYKTDCNKISKNKSKIDLFKTTRYLSSFSIGDNLIKANNFLLNETILKIKLNNNLKINFKIKLLKEKRTPLKKKLYFIK